MAVDETYKNGGSGKGQAVRAGLDFVKFGENLDKIKGTRSKNCIDCQFFNGINSVDIVNCISGKNHAGLTPCADFVINAVY
jgi:hypothetical protein